MIMFPGQRKQEVIKETGSDRANVVLGLCLGGVSGVSRAVLGVSWWCLGVSRWFLNGECLWSMGEGSGFQLNSKGEEMGR